MWRLFRRRALKLIIRRAVSGDKEDGRCQEVLNNKKLWVVTRRSSERRITGSILMVNISHLSISVYHGLTSTNQKPINQAVAEVSREKRETFPQSRSLFVFNDSQTLQLWQNWRYSSYANLWRSRHVFPNTQSLLSLDGTSKPRPQPTSALGGVWLVQVHKPLM